ncbi:ATP-binding protein [Cellulomonas sp. NPDC089187]|uniref:ATP-binding protein n=1 Tax=Cellulomonas sp. NPDC089187 TaxID=3154970 RepID=UPI003412CE5D
MENSARWTVPARRESVPVARRWVVRALAGRELPADLIATVELLVSELVTNAVRHAQTEAVSIAVEVDPDGVRVEVQDDDPLPPSLIAAGPGDPGGRGLGMLGQAGARWGVSDHGPAGKSVWFVLARE